MTKETLGAIALICAGVYVITRAAIQYVGDKRAMAWPTTIGRISVSKVEGQWDRTGDSNSYMYAPHIEYTYEISGISYTGDRFSQYEVSTTGTGYAESVVAKFPMDSEVEIHYDPRNPSKSMLGRAAFTPGTLILLLMLGGSLFVGGVIWLNNL